MVSYKCAMYNCTFQIKSTGTMEWEMCSSTCVISKCSQAYEGGNGLTSNFIFMGKVIILHGMTQFMQIILT